MLKKGREKGLQEGMEKGKEVGIQEEKIQLIQGIDIEDIVKFTNMDMSDIHHIWE